MCSTSPFRLEVALKSIVVGDMLHNIFHRAIKNVAETVDGVDLYILIAAKPIQLRAIYIVVGVQIVLGEAPFFHSLPQTVISDQCGPPTFLIDFSYYPFKIEKWIVFV